MTPGRRVVRIRRRRPALAPALREELRQARLTLAELADHCAAERRHRLLVLAVTVTLFAVTAAAILAAHPEWTAPPPDPDLYHRMPVESPGDVAPLR